MPHKWCNRRADTAHSMQTLRLTAQTQKDKLKSVASCADSSSELRPPSSQQLPAGCFPRTSLVSLAASNGGECCPYGDPTAHKRFGEEFSALGIPRPPQRGAPAIT